MEADGAGPVSSGRSVRLAANTAAFEGVCPSQ